MRPLDMRRGMKISTANMFLTLVFFALVKIFVPHEPGNMISSIWFLLLKLTPFISATIAISYLETDWLKKINLHFFALASVFLVLFSILTPKILYAVAHLTGSDQFDRVYHLFQVFI